jgi:multiple sugar transport system permease protein
MSRSGRAWLLYVPIVIVTAGWLFPIFWTALTSFKPLEAPGALAPDFTFDPTFDNYIALFEDKNFGSFLKNSILIAVGTTLVSLILASLAAYGLSRARMRGTEQLGMWVLSLRMVPPIVVVVPFFLLFNKLALLDTYYGMVIVYLSFSLPFAIWMLQGFFSEVPTSLDEAASADGAGHLKILFRIILPMARSGIAVTTIFTFVFAWNEFLFAFMLTRQQWVTAPVPLGSTATPFQTDWGYLTAGGIVFFLPLLLVVFLLQRQMARGLSFGVV